MDNKILIVVDVQNGFIKTQEHIEKANQIVALVKSGKFDKIVATKFLNYTDSMYERYFNWSDLKTSDETDLYEPLKEFVDATFKKTTYNCVNDDFIELLTELNDCEEVNEVYICGLDTDACVLATAIGLFDNLIAPIVLEDYCFSTGGYEYHKAGIKCLERIVGRNQICKADM